MSSEASGEAKSPGPSQAAELTRQAADRIRDLIVRRQLLPGEKIGQVELARRLGVSRSPLREALRTLESEGIVTYEKNRGYIVSRLDADELAQVYRLRTILEAELLLSIDRPTSAQLDELESLNADMAAAMAAANVTELLRFNREFHFAIFALSPLNLFRREVRRLWHLSEGYRATYLWLPETRGRIVKEHDAIVAALRRYDLAAVVELCTEHRTASEEVVIGLLASPS